MIKAKVYIAGKITGDAEALVRANLPECCAKKIGSMEELRDVMVM